ncbi:hypothetical protein GJ698_14960 [Pseudoduganella sp. FT26W]|uniref:Uncharacterized protein n=1 Tax=Duganella aquatilis TaxID=2666082 RepID=A0A844DD32_9BURK|nr:hypothetical protein [Duganella aquatilis]MRW85384.1 hypothetical protein [Duganella aquatilis]
MSARLLQELELEECPQCIATFYAFFVVANDPTQPRNPMVQHHVSRIVACAAARGFTHADVLAGLVGSGQQLSEQALWLGTRLGEFVGAERMQSMVDDMLADLQNKPINKSGEDA